MTGRLIGVVGPSGVGKDTLMRAVVNASPDFALVQRVITRKPGLGGEDYVPVTEEAFEAMERDGAFCFSWRAHGLRYGLPVDLHHRIGKGGQLLVNLSRNVLAEVAGAFPTFTVLSVTASAETLAARLADRGRETPEEIARRLGRATLEFPAGLNVVQVDNDGPLEDTVLAILAALHPVRA